MTDGKQLLLDVDGIGSGRADALLDHFGHGHWVAESACRYWGEVAKVEGFTEESARELFDKMQDAGVWDNLHDMELEAIQTGHSGDDHGGGW